MNNEIRIAMQLFENKLASFWQLDGEMQQNDWDDDKFFRMETRQRTLQTEVDRARDNLIAEINKLEQRVIETGWEDRMGGQFTQEEINRGDVWGV